jgi:AraC-like DNA-binding protein
VDVVWIKKLNLSMSKTERLGKLFHPVQPRAREGGLGVVYRELLPDPLLRGYICCYWQLKATEPLTASFTYSAVTDACIDFFFDLRSEQENFVAGYSSTSTAFALTNTFNYVGIRFFPGAFPSLYHIPASELTNDVHSLRDVIPQACKRLRDLISVSTDIADIRFLLDRFFKEMAYRQPVKTDERFTASLATIFQAVGAFSIEKDLATLASPRHLRRLFDFYIGASPKEFHRVVRFQKFLANEPTREFLRKEKFYYDAGYYDQSHFIRDFKSLYGVAPSKAFAR